MRFILGMALLTAIAVGLGWVWYRFVRARSPGNRLRRAMAPHGMIDVPLAPNRGESQRPAGAGSTRSTGLA
jgi:hypothetical protein